MRLVDQTTKLLVFHMVKIANYHLWTLVLLLIPSLGFSECSKDCDLTELTFQTELLELNLDRIQQEIRFSQKQEEQLFNELQLVRFNHRLGSIQRKEISSVSIGKEKSELNVQSYPTSDKLNEVEKKASSLRSRVRELELSASRLSREIQRIGQLNKQPGKVKASDEVLDDGIMINVVDSSGRVLQSEHCAGPQCLKSKTLSVDITESGTYYLQLLSGSSTKAWGDGYEIKILPREFADSVRSARSVVPVDVGELISGKLRTKEDVFDYSIKVEEAVEMKIEMSSEVATASGWTVEIYENDNSKIASFDCKAMECKEGRSFFFTPGSSGFYKLSVRSGSEFSKPTGSYTLQFSAKDSVRKEVEPNDITPQKVAFGESLVGSIEEASDMDYYSIEVSKPGRLAVQLTGTE